MRWRRLAVLVGAVTLSVVITIAIVSPKERSPVLSYGDPRSLAHVVSASWTDKVIGPAPRPLPFELSSAHPIKQLVEHAREEFAATRRRQSKTLKEAAAEYRRRYGIHPPPLYDKWFAFAQERRVQLVDEFDDMMRDLMPFWSLPPATLRARVQEAMGYSGNAFITLMIRNGKVAKFDGGPDWQRRVTSDMIDEYSELLPDMDIIFNVHDEPRIVVPADELSRMIAHARQVAMPAARATREPWNEFTIAPGLARPNRNIPEVKSTRFNDFVRQSTWAVSRLSCPAGSPARDFKEGIGDDTSGWALGELGFIWNFTAFSDICQSPSLRDSFGLFQGPNAFKISHELVPVFSQSKVSSYQDILYPSPWYHYGKTVTDQAPETHLIQYNASLDMAWEAKNTSIWWRGSTTGGYSRLGGWRHQHRQQLVARINGKADDVGVLANTGTAGRPQWEARTAPRADHADLVDVRFSGVGQCDKGDCDAQLAYFDMAPPVDPQQAWGYKYLLDMDGNAFSGRFYSFLRSNSLPFKAALFREWHGDWLRPWAHYVPWTFAGSGDDEETARNDADEGEGGEGDRKAPPRPGPGSEHVETLRYLAREPEGDALARGIAAAGQRWAGEALRNADLETWFFRLLLEYARLVDDERAIIGYGG